MANESRAIPADAAQRAAALNPDKSCIVQAPAGSGKTELLTQRFLQMLTRVEHPEELLAITFTRKAAAEMRNRILRAIFPPAGDEQRLAETIRLAQAVQHRDQELNWNLQLHPARLRIRTIDSVNAWLCSIAPLASAGSAAGSQIADTPAELYREAAQRVVEYINTNDQSGQAVRDLLSHLDNSCESLIRLVTRMLATREQWLKFAVDIEATDSQAEQVRAQLEACLHDLVTAELQTAATFLTAAQRQNLLASLQFAAANLQAEIPESRWALWASVENFPAAIPDNLQHWQVIGEFLLTQSGDARRRLNKNNGFPAGKGPNKLQKDAALELITGITEASGATECFAGLKLLPDPAYTDLQWDMLQSLLRVLKLAAAQLMVLFTERSQTDYSAVAQTAIAALKSDGAPSDLALRLDYQIRHVLIDEFQDTSTAQFSLLEALTAGWQEGDGRTLFIVGDPMQSIYRFRQAEVGLFLELQRDGLPNVQLDTITLSTNFRSDPEIVQWVNHAFRQIMPATSDITRGAVGYAPATAIRAANTDSSVTPHPLVKPSRTDEAAQIVTLVHDTLANWPDQTIGILVRSRAHAALIVAALREEGVSFSGTGLETTLETPVIQDLLALTRALSHPADRTAWLGILRAPWCGLTLADLEALAGPDQQACVWDLLNDKAAIKRLSADGQQRAGRLCALLQPVFATRGALSLRDVVEGVWLQLGGPAFLSDAVDLDRAQSFFVALDSVDTGGDCGDAFNLHTQLAEQLRIGDVESRVNVMTIHKAKGLEFDTVILPALEASIRGDDKPLLAWQEIVRPNGETGLIISPTAPTGDNEEPIYEFALRQRKLRSQFESDRLLYVAATRARARLHLFFGVDIDPDAGVKVPAANSLLNRLWPAIANELVDFSGMQGTELKQDAWLNPTVRRYRANWQLPAAPAAYATAADPVIPEAQAVTYDWAGSTAMHIGTVVHRWLQFLAERNCQAWSAVELEARLPTYRLMLAELGVSDPELDSAAAAVLQALCNTFEHEQGRWLLFAEHTDAACEMELHATDRQTIQRFIIDRTFVDASGDRWIVDYKTSTHAGGNLQGFIAAEVERYTPQLASYATAFRLLEPDRRQRVALYFPLLKVFQEIQTG